MDHPHHAFPSAAVEEPLVFESHRGITATFWAEDAQVFVSAYRPDDHRASWLEYLEGLHRTYTSWGVDHILDRARMAAEGCTLFWLLHDLEGEVLGGIRAEGPYTAPGRYACVTEMAASPDASRMVELLGPAVEAGALELKGGWVRPGVGGLGRVLSRCLSHSMWWLGVGHGVGTGSTHVLPSWVSTGGRLLDMAPSAYPSDRYQTQALVWEPDHLSHMDPVQRRHTLRERRYLAPARARIMGDDTLAEWHPELLFDFDPRLDELADAGVELIDHLAEARDELGDLLPPVGTAFHREPSHWVHLPWRNQALHLPGPAAFRRLRTDRNRYKIGGDDLAAARDRTVGVVGLSVGSSAAMTLAQEGLCGALRLADHDRLAITNLNRLSASIADLGEAKTTITARRIAELDPYLGVELVNDGVTADNVDDFVEGLDVVVEECDSFDVKVLVRESARRHRVPVVMETSDRGLLDVERFDAEPDRPVLHGLLEGLDADRLADLSPEDKVPHVLGILEPEHLSAPVAASMVEIDATTRTWPQLASDVTLGASLITATVRRLFTAPEGLRSGRSRLDIDDALDGLTEPRSPRPVLGIEPAPVEHPLLPERFTDAMAQAAALAPSGGNAQPWRFAFTTNTFEVVADPGPGSLMDIGGRGTAVACGAALGNAMAVAAIRERLAEGSSALDLSLDLDRPDVVGRIQLGNRSDAGWAALAPYVPERTTNRLEGPVEALSPELIETLQAAAEAGGGRGVYLPTDRLGDLVELWGEADRARLLAPALHAEMMGELRRPGVDDLDEGLDERTLELSPADRAKLAVLRRGDVMAHLDRWNLGYRLGDDTRRRLRRSAGLVVVVTRGDRRADYVRGGVAMQRLWLTATRLGLWLQPMVPVFGYAHTEDELVERVGEERGPDLFRLSRLAFEQIGVDGDESFVLSARVHRGLPPTAVSGRRRAQPQVDAARTGRRSGEHQATPVQV